MVDRGLLQFHFKIKGAVYIKNCLRKYIHNSMFRDGNKGTFFIILARA